jgi:hypothetical protein
VGERWKVKGGAITFYFLLLTFNFLLYNALMTTIQLQTQISLNSLLEGLQQLDVRELEEVGRRTALLRAQRVAPSLPQAEADLLLKINAGVVPTALQERWAELDGRFQQGTLTAEERAEHLELLDQIELLNAERMGYLVQLAQLRQLSLPELMAQLQIKPLAL